MGALTIKLTDIIFTQCLGRGFIEIEITETIYLSCKGFLSVNKPGT